MKFHFHLSFALLLPRSFRKRSHIDQLTQKLSGWLFASKMCSLMAALSLSVSALSGNFLGIERSIALLGSLVTGVGLLTTMIAIAVLVSLARRFQNDINNEKESSSPRCNEKEGHFSAPPSVSYPKTESRQSLQEQDAQKMSGNAKAQAVLSPMSSLSKANCISFRPSRLPI